MLYYKMVQNIFQKSAPSAVVVELEREVREVLGGAGVPASAIDGRIQLAQAGDSEDAIKEALIQLIQQFQGSWSKERGNFPHRKGGSKSKRKSRRKSKSIRKSIRKLSRKLSRKPKRKLSRKTRRKLSRKPKRKLSRTKRKSTLRTSKSKRK